jgi:probable HAF family extracellular repeat protein
MTAKYQIHAFLYSHAVMTDLGTLGGANSHAYGINNLGQIVGSAQTASGITHAFVYTGGTMTDLNNLLPANSGWLVLTQATSINDRGQITGTGITVGGFTHAFQFYSDE